MKIDELERELRATRQEPDPEFARRLDEWAASGFPRDGGLGPHAAGTGRVGASGASGRLLRRLLSTSPRRMLAPAASVATMLIVVGVAITQSGELGDESADGTRPQLEDSGGDAAGGSAEVAPESAATEELELAAPDTSGAARGEDQRIVDATARITLGAAEDEVQGVANDVVAVADRHRGVVANSQVTTDQGGARASFELEIPYKRLDAALTEISELGDVISRTESGEDITAQAVRARRDLADVFERIREARIERIDADSHEQRAIINARINSLRATADSLRTQIEGVKREGRFATVNVEITSNGPDSATGDDGWSLSDALDDAGRVLEVLGGIALITLAVLVPLTAVGLLAWLAATRALRRSRERALDQPS